MVLFLYSQLSRAYQIVINDRTSRAIGLNRRTSVLDTIEFERSLSIHKNELGTLPQHTLSKQLDA